MRSKNENPHDQKKRTRSFFVFVLIVQSDSFEEFDFSAQQLIDS